MRSPIFDQAHREQEIDQRWTLQSEKMLRVALGPEVLAAQRAMVAYQGDIDFSCQGSKNLGGMLKKAVTGEGGNLMRASGQGEVFFARSAQNVFLLQLEGDAITVSTHSLLVGRGSGESFQLGFHGAGFVVVQPSEGQPVVDSS